MVDEDDDPYAFFCDEDGSEGEASDDRGELWEVRDLRGTLVKGHRSLTALCRASTALCEEAPALEVKGAGEPPELDEY